MNDQPSPHNWAWERGVITISLIDVDREDPYCQMLGDTFLDSMEKQIDGYKAMTADRWPKQWKKFVRPFASLYLIYIDEILRVNFLHATYALGCYLRPCGLNILIRSPIQPLGLEKWNPAALAS